MARSNPAKFGFLLTRAKGAATGTMARFTCARCPAEIDITPGYPLNPEAISKTAERRGWIADAYRASANRCPDCANARSQGEGVKSSEKVIVMLKPAPPAPEAKPEPKPQTLRPATPDERFRIRTALDKHFDDSRGRYLDGMSDQKLGEQLNLPWAMVTTIREAAYGPIRVDPEIEGLLGELSSLREEQVKLQADAKRISEGQMRVTDNIMSLQTRLTELQARIQKLG